MSNALIGLWQTADLLSTPASQSFFCARECEAYFSALRHAYARRDFHQSLIETMVTFLKTSETEAAQAQITQLISACSTQEKCDTVYGNASQTAQGLHPEGYRLLRLSGDLSFEVLHAAYRKAAMRHHPDLGGQPEAMKAVNEAYDLFHCLLTSIAQSRADGDVHWMGIASHGIPVTCAADYRVAVSYILFEVAVDEWDLEAALNWLRRVCAAYASGTPWARSEHMRQIVFWRCWFDFMPTLLMSHLRGVIDEVMNLASSLEPRDSNAAEVSLAGKKRVVNHERQAANALRFGMISEIRYDEVMKRLTKKRDQDSDQQAFLDDFVKKTGFISDLPTDKQADVKKQVAERIPSPDVFAESVDDLTCDQHAEYLDTFRRGDDLESVRKYTVIRLTSLLESSIVYCSTIDLQRVEKECDLLGRLQRPNINDCCQNVGAAVRFLACLPVEERNARVAVLRRLHDLAGPRTFAPFFAADENGLDSAGMPRSATFRISAQSSYPDIVQSPMDRLQLAIATDSLQTAGEAKADQFGRLADFRILKKFQAEEPRLFALLNRAKECPGEISERLGSYCERRLSLGPELYDPGELQIGFWINNLTIALTRLSRWRDSVAWLERFFALPDTYRRRSSRSEIEQMQKRLLRSRSKAE